MRTASNLDEELILLVQMARQIDKEAYVAENINDQHYAAISWVVSEYFEDRYFSQLQATRNKKDSAAVVEARKLIKTCTDVFFDVIVMRGPLSSPLTPGQNQAIINNFAHLSVNLIVRANLKAEYVGAYGATLKKNGEPSGEEKLQLTIHEEKTTKKRKKTNITDQTHNKCKKKPRDSVGSSNDQAGRPNGGKQSISTQLTPIDTGNNSQ